LAKAAGKPGGFCVVAGVNRSVSALYIVGRRSTLYKLEFGQNLQYLFQFNFEPANEP
jgi:hypothetical protein